MRFAKVVLLPALVVGGVVFACGDDSTSGGSGPGGAGGSTSSGGGSSSGGGGPLSSGGTSSGSTSSSSGSPEDAGEADDGGLGASFKAYDINYILSTGQSLSVGAQGAPVLSTAQPDDNLMFNTGVIAGNTNLTSFVPLVEKGNETMSSSLVNHISGDAKVSFGLSHVLLLSAHGVGGQPYAKLKKGEAPYANGMAQTKAAVDLAKARGKSLVVRLVTNVHGESDHVQQNKNYQANIAEWQANYEADVKALTGQTEAIPMLHTQMHSWTRYRPGGASAPFSSTSQIPLDQLAEHIASNGKTVLVGPKYQVEYVADGVHLTNRGYRHMGEYYAKAYRQIVLRGKKWEPLRPISVTRSGAIITVKFIVPVPPLKLDTELVTNPADFGFEIAGGNGPVPNIESVDVAGPDTVTIKLATAPTGNNLRLRYAFTGTPGADGGPKTGARGNLRDSDETKSLYDFKLYNWCVTFDEALP